MTVELWPPSLQHASLSHSHLTVSSWKTRVGTPHDQTLKAVAVATLGQEEDGLHAGSLGKDFKSSQKDSNCGHFPFCARAYWVRFKTTFQVLPILSRVSHSVSQFEEVANAVLLPISYSSLIHPKDPGSLSLLQHVV